MSEREPTMEKRAVRMPDGRRLVFYTFPEPAPQADASPPPRPPARPAPPRRGEG